MYHIEFMENGQCHRTNIMFKDKSEAELYAELNLKTSFKIFKNGGNDE
jgi:hypothetical protein